MAVVLSHTSLWADVQESYLFLSGQCISLSKWGCEFTSYICHLHGFLRSLDQNPKKVYQLLYLRNQIEVTEGNKKSTGGYVMNRWPFVGQRDGSNREEKQLEPLSHGLT